MIDKEVTKRDIPMMVSLEDIDYIIQGHAENLHYLKRQGVEYILMGVYHDHCWWGPYQILNEKDYHAAIEDLQNKINSLEQFRSQYETV